MDKERTAELLIVIPTYNEAGNIKSLIERIQRLDLSCDIMIIDDGSPDGTGEIAERLAKVYGNMRIRHRDGKSGIGSAHFEGIKYAYEKSYRFLLTMDADFSHTPEDIPRFLEKIKEADIVIGTRFQREESLKEWNYYRKFLTYLGYFLTRNLLGIPYDASGAMRLYRLCRIRQDIFSLVEARDYAFFFESLTILNLNGLRIAEIPIDLPSRVYGSSKMELRQITRSVTHLIKLSLRIRLKKRGLCLGPAGPCNHKTKDEWDAYWLNKKDLKGIVYDFFAQIYRKLIFRKSLNYFVDKNFERGLNLMHAGCGSGQVDADISRKVCITALDTSKNALDIYRRNNNGAPKLIQGSIFSIPCKDGSFDGIYNLGVMEHFTQEEIRAILKEFNRILKRNGRILLFWPHRFGLTVIILKLIHKALAMFCKDKIKLHPDEITFVRSRRQIDGMLKNADFLRRDYYFGIRDFFTFAVIVGIKSS